jgi:hypothetical protein
MEPVWSVYENRIVIKLDPVPENEKSAMEGFCKRLDHSEVEGPIAKECGYIFSDVNCDLRLLHHLFGADIVGYLFDKTWIPIAKPVPTIYFPREFIPSDAKFGETLGAVVRPFRPELFLARLSVFERNFRQLKDGAITPISLPELTAYLRGDGGTRLQRFIDDEHRLRLEISLSELRDFGELGLSRWKSSSLCAKILFSISYSADEMETLTGVRSEPGSE